MKIEDATALLQSPHHSYPSHQTWADLGAGTGTFTLALAEILSPPGRIVAVDNNAGALRQIPSLHHQIIIETRQTDFTEEDLSLENLDGILMANALHYVKDKVIFINKLCKYLKEDGCFLIVEYETDRANPWVPYPIRFEALRELFITTGFLSAEKLGEAPSRYQGKMYAAFISKKKLD